MVTLPQCRRHVVLLFFVTCCVLVGVLGAEDAGCPVNYDDPQPTWLVEGTKKGAIPIRVEKRPLGKKVTIISNVRGGSAAPGELITALRRVKLEDMRNSQRLNVTLSNVFQSLIARMCFRAKLSAPCVLAGLISASAIGCFVRDTTHAPMPDHFHEQ